MMKIEQLFSKKSLLNGGVFLWWVLGFSVNAQSPLEPSSAPRDGERLDFLVTYEWGPFYLAVGDASFTTVQLHYGDVRLWSFEGWGASKKHWNWFYPVQSIYASLANDDFIPLHFQRKGREGSHRYDRWYDFGSSSQISWTSQDAELPSGSAPLPSGSNVFDLMTAVHWCRHLPWDSLTPGKTVSMRLILDGDIHPTSVKFEGLTNWTDPETLQVHRCWAFQPTLIDGTVFKEGDHMRVLVSADERRIPLYIETELVIGSAKIYLTRHQMLETGAMKSFRDSTERQRNTFMRE